VWRSHVYHADCRASENNNPILHYLIPHNIKYK
jgi:hypothetical protein